MEVLSKTVVPIDDCVDFSEWSGKRIIYYNFLKNFLIAETWKPINYFILDDLLQIEPS